jgi:polysaccharide export outer membrane protein
LKSAIVLLVALTGCAFAPGMEMNESAVNDRGRAETKDPNFHIQLINAQVLAKLREDAAKANPLLPDPDANKPIMPYVVAPFDVLQVTVWDHPELTSPAGQTFRQQAASTDPASNLSPSLAATDANGNLVQADGTVFYPYVGVVKVAGMTLPQIRTLFTQRLSATMTKPQLDVRVSAFRGKRVQITGEVVFPSAMPITDVPARVQDAITYARGFTPDADQGSVTLTRAGKTYALDLLALYERGDLSQNWLLEDGDVINVGDRIRNRVFVIGEVRLQQAKPMNKRRMSLAEALSDSGGLDPLAANAGRIYVIRGDFNAPTIFHLDASSPDALLLATQFPLKPLDVVFVSSTGLARYNRVMSQILPTVQALYDAALSIDVARRQ